MYTKLLKYVVSNCTQLAFLSVQYVYLLTVQNRTGSVVSGNGEDKFQRTELSRLNKNTAMTVK